MKPTIRRATTLLTSVLFSAQFALTQKYPQLPPRATPSPSDQKVLLLLAGQSASDHILLTLNNNKPGETNVSSTLYTTGGIALALPDVKLKSAESRIINFSGMLRDAHILGPLGYIELRYSGLLMEVGAQLTLILSPAAQVSIRPAACHRTLPLPNGTRSLGCPTGHSLF